MNDNKSAEIIFQTKLPKYKEGYEQEIVLHIINQYEYKKYGWLVVPVIAVAIAMTHYILNH